MLGYLALRATTKSGGVEAGCCATLMLRDAPWLETSSRHVRRVASRLRRRLSRRTRTPPPRRTKTPASRASRNCWGLSPSPNLSSEAELLRRISAPQNVVTWNYNGNSAVAIHVAFVQHSRSECGFVYRGGGFRVLKPCQRPTGLSGGMPHGEGLRHSCRAASRRDGRREAPDGKASGVRGRA